VMTDHPRAQGEPFHDGITLFTSNGSLTVDSIKAWKMRSAYHRNDVDGERPGAER